MAPLPPPPLPAPGRDLAIPGFRLGHATDRAARTGVTVILCPEGALAAAEVRGSATGTRQFDSLVSALHVASRAHAVVLSGGSGFGLAAADPVVEHLARGGHGFQTGVVPIPLVPTAILFDLGLAMGTDGGAFDPQARPWARLGAEAVAAAAADAAGPDAAAAGAASRPVAVGSVGAGTGATVGKALGIAQAMKGGFGFASLAVQPAGPTVAAAVAVNAFGDVRDPATGETVAGCRLAPDSLELAGAERVLAAMRPEGSHPWEGNTTLAVVMTDADLPKAALLKVCQMAFGGLYRALAPALSQFDGDLVVTLATGARPAHVNQIGTLAQHAVAHAIVAAVREADGLGLLPAWRDLPARG